MAAAGRPERTLVPTGTVLDDLARDLRQLREKSGMPLRELAARCHFSIGALSTATSGRRLPTLEVTLAFATSCGGDPEAWRSRWQEAHEQLRTRKMMTKKAAAWTGGRPMRRLDLSRTRTEATSE